jgi:hypothetical protein
VLDGEVEDEDEEVERIEEEEAEEEGVEVEEGMLVGTMGAMFLQLGVTNPCSK